MRTMRVTSSSAEDDSYPSSVQDQLESALGHSLQNILARFGPLTTAAKAFNSNFCTIRDLLVKNETPVEQFSKTPHFLLLVSAVSELMRPDPTSDELIDRAVYAVVTLQNLSEEYQAGQESNYVLGATDESKV